MDTSATGLAKLAALWGIFWTAAGLLFWHADRRGFALCKAVRWLFGTHTRRGRIKFWASLLSGAVILGRHICKAAD